MADLSLVPGIERERYAIFAGQILQPLHGAAAHTLSQRIGLEPLDFHGIALAQAGLQLKHGKLLIISLTAQGHHVVVLPSLRKLCIDFFYPRASFLAARCELYGFSVYIIYAHGDIYR